MVGQTTTVFWMALLFAIARMLHVIGFSSSAGSHLKNFTGNRRFFLLYRMVGTGLTLILSFTIGIMLILALNAL
jgi:hypothetical protein